LDVIKLREKALQRVVNDRDGGFRRPEDRQQQRSRGLQDLGEGYRVQLGRDRRVGGELS